MKKHLIFSIILIIFIVLAITFFLFFKDGLCNYSDIFVQKAVLKHDAECFTEGLFVYNGCIYESVGLKGCSTIIKYDMNMNKLAKQTIDDNDFGEGSTVFNGKIYMLTETSNIVYIFDADSLEILGKKSYNRTGWGLTTDEKYLIASDGTDTLYYMNESFETIKTVKVKFNGKAVENINELEYINGEIWANVWFQDYVIVIDSISGKVKKKISLKDLVPPENELKDRNSVLNGIAFDKENNTVYFTGKNWKKIYCFNIIG